MEKLIKHANGQWELVKALPMPPKDYRFVHDPLLGREGHNLWHAFGIDGTYHGYVQHPEDKPGAAQFSPTSAASGHYTDHIHSSFRKFMEKKE